MFSSSLSAWRGCADALRRVTDAGVLRRVDVADVLRPVMGVGEVVVMDVDVDGPASALLDELASAWRAARACTSPGL